MNSADNPPSLALSDIMHHMSPSPVPPDEHATNVYDFASGEASKDTNLSVESSSQIDVANMRRRLNELGYPVARQRNVGNGGMPSGIISREKELLDIVLSLLNTVPIDPAQLERQAEIISDLTAQRDYLVRQATEDRERWHSEKESWERSAEALLLVRNKPSKPEDAERMRASYEADNKALRDKLYETQRRQASLEAELLKLKPMLLMQPNFSRTDKGKAREAAQPKFQVEFVEPGATQHSAHKKTSAPKVVVNAPLASTSKAAATAPSSANADSSIATQQRPPRDRPSKSQSKKPGPPLMSDAYSEHLLLAAKRLGRKRVATITGYNKQAEREKESVAQEQDQMRSQQDLERTDQERQERVANGAFGAYYRTGAEASTSATSPAPRMPHIIPVIGNSPLRTPKRGGIHFSNFASAQNNLAAPVPESPLVYVNVNSAVRSPWAGSGVMGTPGQIKATLSRQNGRSTANEKAPASNPPTPLASLLDAALMIDGDDNTASKLRSNKANGKGRVIEEPESPVPPPKRRRISAAGSSQKNAAGNVGQGKRLERVKTALDVLADQADQASAAFNEADHSERRSSVAKANGNTSSKGKGKAKQKSNDYHPAEGQAGEENDDVNAVEAAQASISTSGHGRGRGARRESAGNKSRNNVPSSASTAVISSRPVRQSSRKRAASPVQPTASSSTRGSARLRGRAKGPTNSRGRSVSDAGSVRVISPPGPRIISPPGPRVIAPGPGYSPLDEAIAMSSSVAGKAKEIEKNGNDDHDHDQPQPHPQSQHQSHQPEQPLNEPMIGGLRPVVGWGQRNRQSPSDSDSSPLRGNSRKILDDKDNHDDNKTIDDKDTDEISQFQQDSEPSAPVVATSALEPATASATPTPMDVDNHSITEPPKSRNGRFLDIVLSPASPPPLPLSHSPSIEPSTAAQVDVHVKASSPSGDEDADAEADEDEDQDAEGEQEDEEEEPDQDDDGVDNSMKHSSRSKSPPPPDPPPPGPGGGSPPNPGEDDDHDADADAEGEVEFEDNEYNLGGGVGTTMSSSHRKHTTIERAIIILTDSRASNNRSISLVTCRAASKEHTHIRVDASGLSDYCNAATLGLIIWMFDHIPAKRESKRAGAWFSVKRGEKSCSNGEILMDIVSGKASVVAEWFQFLMGSLEFVFPHYIASLTSWFLFESRSFDAATL